MSLSPQAIARAYLAACEAELAALKPGNVHRHAGGHRMKVADFEMAAAASAPHLAAPGASVGERILAATVASVAIAGQNVNLGIVLLAAPLAVAAETGYPVAEIVADTTMEDAAAAFAAIALANPGGLSTATENDVRGPALVTLAEAMRLAAPRDAIAAEWTAGFAGVLAEPEAEAGAIYLRRLAVEPDSHVARRFGAATAEGVRAEAAALGPAPERAALLAFDASLKARRLNPGATADLTVACLFAQALRRAGAALE